MQKGIKWLLILSVITLVADLASTLINWELIKYLEANPLFKYGGLPLILFINVLYFLFVWWTYKKAKNPTIRFIMMLVLVSVITTRIVVVYNNIQIFLNPPTIQQAMQITTQMKQAYVTKVAALNILPYINGYLAFLFFKRDHTIEKNE